MSSAPKGERKYDYSFFEPPDIQTLSEEILESGATNSFATPDLMIHALCLCIKKQQQEIQELIAMNVEPGSGHKL